MAPQAILGSDWSLSKKCSPLKPIDQMNRSLVGSILHKDCSFRPDPFPSMSTTAIQFLIDFKKIFSSETALPSEEKFGRKHLRKVLITFPQTE
jgi:hypothetical protein